MIVGDNAEIKIPDQAPGYRAHATGEEAVKGS